MQKRLTEGNRKGVSYSSPVKYTLKSNPVKRRKVKLGVKCTLKFVPYFEGKADLIFLSGWGTS